MNTFWDRTAQLYDAFQKITNAEVIRLMPKVVAALLDADDHVLECACGTGLLTVKCAPECASVVATDLSEKMMQRARKKCRAWPNVRFEKADILRLPYENAAFDKTIAANVIHLLERPWEALQELKRVTKPGGLLILPTYIARKNERETSSQMRFLDRAGAGFQRSFTVEGYEQFLKNMGLQPDIQLITGRLPCAVAVAPCWSTSAGYGHG